MLQHIDPQFEEMYGNYWQSQELQEQPIEISPYLFVKTHALHPMYLNM